MFGGYFYGKLHALEADYSVRIFTQFVAHLPSRKRAFEVGAGIGRISKTLLKEVFEEIDILD